MRPALLLLPLLTLAQDTEVLRSSVALVPVTVSITDKSGRPVDDVKLSEIQLLDNGRPREIRYFSQDFNAPLTVGLITDASGSQREFFQQHSSALKRFVSQVLRPADQGFLISIGGYLGASDVQMVHDLTGSIEGLHSSIDGLRQGAQPAVQFGQACLTRRCRYSAIWNGVFSAIDLRMKNILGRKALVLLTDGVDTGSQNTLERTIQAAQAADTPVYTIHTAKNRASGYFNGLALINARGGGHMKKLSNETGGRPYDNPDDDMPKVFAQIESELRNLYVLTFAVPEDQRDNKFHKLEVKISRKDLRARARQGYIAK
jgi:VWFA-related protein